jgi:glutamate-1-semialdehyde 2,1-aminomutase
MELGGLDHPHERVFLLSTTHGAETHGLAAAIATIETYQREPVIATLYSHGSRLLNEGTQIIAAHRLEDHIQIIGRPCCLTFTTLDHERRPSQAMRSLLMQEMIQRGILMTSLVVSYTHTDQDIDRTLAAIDAALPVCRRALSDGVEPYLVGRASKPLYRRYNFPGAQSS